ncbi:hypothetical protein [Devosia lacusdianchii]|uniref:hypothetical protein n=1 Tax=Devosia lacusdianchii TaxID=2917991 RepID=UPI001F0591EA|nr:hypothetical protein [Devosia sp. JXJ CY 41]
MEKLLELPPLAIITFGAVLALIFGVRYLGLWQGQNASPGASAGSAQVAAVIVDPTALNAAAAAVEGLTLAVTEANVIGRAHTEATDQLADNVDDLAKRIDRLTDKVIDAAAKLK